MNDIDVSGLLAQMRALANETQTLGEPAKATPETSFSQVLGDSIDAVNQTQQKASALAEAFESGDPNVDLAEVMISLQKANVSFTAMTEVRNKLVNAYQDIMNMPV